MQTQCLAGARFALVRACFVRVVGAHTPVVPGCGSPDLRLVFIKGNLAAQTWWAQVGSNHRHLACKAEYGQEYTQLSGLVHALELRKPCPEMPWGAWESLHGGSRKWFPEQSADPSLLERVRAWRQGYCSRTRRMAGRTSVP